MGGTWEPGVRVLKGLPGTSTPRILKASVSTQGMCIQKGGMVFDRRAWLHRWLQAVRAHAAVILLTLSCLWFSWEETLVRLCIGGGFLCFLSQTQYGDDKGWCSLCDHKGIQVENAIAGWIECSQARWLVKTLSKSALCLLRHVLVSDELCFCHRDFGF